ncbi:unnamed protein product [Nippostrongylus brasiliensis]|uniref:Probable methylmalonate-semialdehyde/malonate-semialdehyde dehydrogenase [acylating], mitochondrial n=1 Tax=Nippostrongylus brasiliensis TaxID=27835 RepID=A0A0N4YLP2_NIPBR|nr:unnamed protein product [Nippostrongylus brasiliensis]
MLGMWTFLQILALLLVLECNGIGEGDSATIRNVACFSFSERETSDDNYQLRNSTFSKEKQRSRGLATNEVISRVPKCTQAEMQAAVDSSKAAFASWKHTSPLTRQQSLFRLQALIKRDIKKLAENITQEQGKTLPDAEGDVSRGLQVVEHACSVPSLMLGETLPNVSRDMDTYSFRIPLGVTAGICPFNFPAMIPLWMFPLAIATGNTMVLKPSEQDPGACMMLVELAKEAGVPNGVVNVIHGQHDAVNFICDNPDIHAISFVGADQAVRWKPDSDIGPLISKAAKERVIGLIQGAKKVDLTYTVLG